MKRSQFALRCYDAYRGSTSGTLHQQVSATQLGVFPCKEIRLSGLTFSVGIKLAISVVLIDRFGIKF
jgi:hypothetical protein